MTNKELLEALEALFEPAPEVNIGHDGQKFVAVVVSTSFEGMDEAERQSLVWGHLQQRFEDHQLVQLEFVFTNTPGEDKELAS